FVARTDREFAARRDVTPANGRTPGHGSAVGGNGDHPERTLTTPLKDALAAGDVPGALGEFTGQGDRPPVGREGHVVDPVHVADVEGAADLARRQVPDADAPVAEGGEEPAVRRRPEYPRFPFEATDLHAAGDVPAAHALAAA